MNNAARVLVVDDDEATLPVYRSLLTGGCFITQYVGTAAEALQALAQRAFDVVLIDCLIPGNDGLALLRAIRELDEDAEILVITRAPTLEQAKAAMRLGASDYMAKPVAPEEVVKAAASAAIRKKWVLHRVTVLDPAQPSREGETI